jgi:hypothetical protein
MAKAPPYGEGMSFLIRLPLLTAESLSSWRQRNGSANGFRWFPTLNARPAGDPDRCPNADEIDWLSREFAVPVPTLRASSLERYVETLIGRSSPLAFLRWIIPCSKNCAMVGAVNGYCPVCLSVDARPYFRLAWRLAFITHCPIHKCRLLERCSRCTCCAWPTVYLDRASFPQTWMDIARCAGCGHLYSHENPIVDERHDASVRLWGALDSGKVPSNGPSGISLPDYFAALWSVSRLVRRNLPRLQGLFPFQDPIDQISADASGNTIERLPGTARQAIVSAAMWLLENWPMRLVEVCKAVDISGSDFSCTQSKNPQWFDDALREHLFQHTKWITRGHVRTAMEELNAKGLAISKNALRRSLRVSESWAINELLDQRRRASIDELATLCRHYHAILAHTPPSRDQQRTLSRDVLMLLISAFSGKPIEEVCEMDAAAVARVFRTAKTSFDPGLDSNTAFVVGCLDELGDQYRQGIRPQFVARGDALLKSWFISRFGKKMDGHSVRARIAKMMKQTLEPALWNSADVFRSIFCEAP